MGMFTGVCRTDRTLQCAMLLHVALLPTHYQRLRCFDNRSARGRGGAGGAPGRCRTALGGLGQVQGRVRGACTLPVVAPCSHQAGLLWPAIRDGLCARLAARAEPFTGTIVPMDPRQGLMPRSQCLYSFAASKNAATFSSGVPTMTPCPRFMICRCPAASWMVSRTRRCTVSFDPNRTPGSMLPWPHASAAITHRGQCARFT